MSNIFLHLASGGIGDVVIFLPVLFKLLIDNPGNHYVITARDDIIKIFLEKELSPHNNFEIITIDFGNRVKAVKALLVLRKKIFKDSHFPISVGIFKVLISKIILLNFRKISISNLYNQYSLIKNPKIHKLKAYALVCNVGTISSTKKTIDLTQERDKVIVLAPGSSKLESHKRWPLQHYADLSNLILEKLDFDLKIIGTHDELDLLRPIFENIRNKTRAEIILVNSIEDTLQIFKNSSLLISGCSGNMHIGSYAGIATIALYGPTDYKITGPINFGTYPISAGLQCSPCYSYQRLGCGNPICMKSISPEMVLNKLLTLVKL